MNRKRRKDFSDIGESGFIDVFSNFLGGLILLSLFGAMSAKPPRFPFIPSPSFDVDVEPSYFWVHGGRIHELPLRGLIPTDEPDVFLNPDGGIRVTIENLSFSEFGKRYRIEPVDPESGWPARRFSESPAFTKTDWNGQFAFLFVSADSYQDYEPLRQLFRDEGAYVGWWPAKAPFELFSGAGSGKRIDRPE